MESSERRKLNRLLRKPTHSGLNKSSVSKHKFISRGFQKPRSSISGAGSNTNSGDDETKGHGFSADLMHLCAEMCGVSGLQQPAALCLRKHLMQICRLMVHNILRVMEQSRRGVPQAVDVDLASVLIGLEPTFGTSTSSFLPIRTGGRTASSGPGGKVFFIRPDKEIDLKALLLREPAGVVYDASLTAHWLAVNGRQPTSPQNPPPEFVARMLLLNGTSAVNQVTSKSTPSVIQTSDQAAARDLCVSDVKQSVSSLSGKRRGDVLDSEPVCHPRCISALSINRRSHEVSQEVMIYFRELTEACVGANENRRHEALDNATLDPGLQPILPHLVTFITEGVRVNVTNHNLAILIYLMRLVKALVDNPHMSLEPYLHLLVPTVITCVLNRQLCAKPITDNHWALRDFAAKQLVTLCNRHNTSSNELYNRVTRELSRALCNWIEGTSVGVTTGCGPMPNFSGPRLCPDNQNRKYPMDYSDRKEMIKSEPVAPAGPATRGPSLGNAVHSMNTLYGILVALAEFGAQCLRILVFPLLPALCQRLTELVEPNPGADTAGVESSDASISSFAMPGRLAPADERSFEFLKIMMTNRISSLLADWRTRQNLGTSLDDYRASYGCMATCLHTANRSSSTVAVVNPAPVVYTSNPAGSTSNTTLGTGQQTNPGFYKSVTRSLLTNSAVPITKAVDHTHTVFPTERSNFLSR